MEPIKTKQRDNENSANATVRSKNNSTNNKNEKIITGGNQHSNEDDLDPDKQPYHDDEFNEADLQTDFNEDPDEQSFNAT